MNTAKDSKEITEYQFLHAKAPTALIEKYSNPCIGVVYGVVWYLCRPRGVCYASQETIGKWVGLGRKTVGKHISTLVKDGYLVDLNPNRKPNQTRALGVTEQLAEEDLDYRDNSDTMFEEEDQEESNGPIHIEINSQSVNDCSNPMLPYEQALNGIPIKSENQMNHSQIRKDIMEKSSKLFKASFAVNPIFIPDEAEVIGYHEGLPIHELNDIYWVQLDNGEILKSEDPSELFNTISAGKIGTRGE